MARPNSGELATASQTSNHPPAAQALATHGLGNPFGGPALPPASKDSPTLSGLLHALKRRWVLATFIGLLVGAMAGVGIWMALPGGKHQARASVEVRSHGADLARRTSEDVRDQLYMVKTRDLFNRTLSEPSVASLPMVRESEDPIRILEDGVEVKLTTPTILQVSLPGDRPEEIKTILDVLVKKYIDDANSWHRLNRDKEAQQLDRQYEQLRNEYQSRDNDLKRLIANSHSSGRDPTMIKSNEMQTAAVKGRTELADMEKQFEERKVLIDLFEEQLKKGIVKLDPFNLEKLINVDIRVAALLQDKLVKQRRLDREQKVGEPTAPLIVELKAQLKQLDEDVVAKRAEIRGEVEGEAKTLSKQLLASQVEEMRQQQMIEERRLAFQRDYVTRLESRIKQGNVGDHEIESLRRDLEPQRKYLDKLGDQVVALRLEREAEPRVRIREAPYVNMNQNLKQKTLFASLGSVAAFGLVVLVVSLLEWRTRRIDGVDQVVNDLGMRIIGTVPAFPTKAGIKAASEGRQANWRFILNESINSTPDDAAPLGPQQQTCRW